MDKAAGWRLWSRCKGGAETCDCVSASEYHRRWVPVTTMSVSWLPQTEQTRRFDQSRTLVSGPCRLAISAGAGST
jgi:hypothetical protein